MPEQPIKIAATQPEPPTRRWAVLALLGVAQLMVVLDVTIVNVALPSAQRALGFSTDSRQWVVTAYALAFGSLLLLGGKLGDLFGRKWTFVAGLIGFAGASALGGLAQSFGMLVAARALQGAFGALLAPSALALLAATFAGSPDRPKAFGIFGAIAGAGGSFGLVLGGALTQAASWRWCLYVNLVIAIPTAIVCQAPPEDECVTGATEHAAWATMYGATVTLSDPTPPTLSAPSGALWGSGEAGGFHKGTESVTVAAADVGGGVASIVLSADGRPVETYTAPCNFTFAQPCPSSTGTQTLTLPTTGLSDGTHTLALVATDAAGNQSTVASEQITVENSSPPPPVGLSATPTQAGGSTFTATWTDPAGQVAPITGALYQVCPASGSGSCSAPAQAPAAGPATVTVPGPEAGASPCGSPTRQATRAPPPRRTQASSSHRPAQAARARVRAPATAQGPSRRSVSRRRCVDASWRCM